MKCLDLVYNFYFPSMTAVPTFWISRARFADPRSKVRHLGARSTERPLLLVLAPHPSPAINPLLGTITRTLTVAKKKHALSPVNLAIRLPSTSGRSLYVSNLRNWGVSRITVYLICAARYYLLMIGSGLWFAYRPEGRAIHICDQGI
jgi:hypothetical protein